MRRLKAKRLKVKDNRQGSTLIFTLLITAVLLMLGSALFARVILEARIAQNQQQELLLHYLAEAGLERIKAEILFRQETAADLEQIDWGETEVIQAKQWIHTPLGIVEVAAELQGVNAQGNLLVQATARLPNGYKQTHQAEFMLVPEQVKIVKYTEVYAE